ncbi:carbohydrate binding domain-containing protein [Spirochaeta thermophila]|uniref:CBM-cenC domain-containing protein n=1 Tax=Winmispira thermophila (strain ATCC 49972 / DSM 6192 / RI 19.B1) TaxID=665571 RepID=E0RUB5_WINT6|nr:carbohydrate binding domain-containing protein [Spirochaeta thermophila]ADN02336.1 hypothetical protein STHERM_c13960 [Spirochaeta thermophila DSM 6192]
MKRFMGFRWLLIVLLLGGCASQQVTMAETPASPQQMVIVSNDFEDQKPGDWMARGDGTRIAISDAAAHSGKYSLYVSNRSANWHGTQIDLLKKLQPGKKYSFSVWVYHTSASAKKLIITMERIYNGEKGWDRIAEVSVAPNTWVELKGEYQVQSAKVEELVFYVEAESSSLSYYVDDVTISQVK